MQAVRQEVHFAAVDWVTVAIVEVLIAARDGAGAAHAARRRIGNDTGIVAAATMVHVRGRRDLATVARIAVAVFEAGQAGQHLARAARTRRCRLRNVTGRAGRRPAAERRIVLAHAASVARLLTARAALIGVDVERRVTDIGIDVRGGIASRASRRSAAGLTAARPGTSRAARSPRQYGAARAAGCDRAAGGVRRIVPEVEAIEIDGAARCEGQAEQHRRQRTRQESAHQSRPRRPAQAGPTARSTWRPPAVVPASRFWSSTNRVTAVTAPTAPTTRPMFAIVCSRFPRSTASR